MKNKSISLLSATLIIAAISAFGLSDQAKSSQKEKSSCKADTETMQLADIGINGGIKIDARTGLKTDFFAPKVEPAVSYLVRGYANEGFLMTIAKQKMNEAKLISDVIENYPSSWIQGYNSVSISGVVNGEEWEGVGKDEVLSERQKEILASAPEVFICVQYQQKNTENLVQNRQMNVTLVSTPETSAEFNGGYEKLVQYLRAHSEERIVAKDFRYLPKAAISFLINEEGNAENVVIDNSSKDEEIDQLLVKVIKEMPQWEAGVNAKGQPVKQKFILAIGEPGC